MHASRPRLVLAAPTVKQAKGVVARESYVGLTAAGDAHPAMIRGVVLRTQPDARLAALARDGSEPAFEAIVQRYRRLLLAYCRRLLLSDSRSEDVVQQACLSAWAALRAGTEVRELGPWLFRITHNEAMRALRRPGYDFDELTESVRGADAPEADLERRIHIRETLAAVAALPELQREAILRTAVDGSSYEQVAGALGLTGGAVRGLVHRARTSLRSGLAVFAPAPLVLWAAGQDRRGGTLAGWLEALAGGGSAGGAVVAAKGATLLATTAVVVGGTVGGAIDPHLFTDRTATRRAAAVDVGLAGPRRPLPVTSHPRSASEESRGSHAARVLDPGVFGRTAPATRSRVSVRRRVRRSAAANVKRGASTGPTTSSTTSATTGATTPASTASGGNGARAPVPAPTFAAASPGAPAPSSGPYGQRATGAASDPQPSADRDSAPEPGANAAQPASPAAGAASSSGADANICSCQNERASSTPTSTPSMHQ